MDFASALLSHAARLSEDVTGLMSTRDVIIPRQQWEAAAAEMLDISFAQMRFVFSLFLAIPLNAALRGIRAPWARHTFSIVAGLLLVRASCVPGRI